MTFMILDNFLTYFKYRLLMFFLLLPSTHPFPFCLPEGSSLGEALPAMVQYLPRYGNSNANIILALRLLRKLLQQRKILKKHH